MGVVVLRGNCPTNEGSCPMGIIVLRGRSERLRDELGLRCPEGALVLGGNWQSGSKGGYCPMG